MEDGWNLVTVAAAAEDRIAYVHDYSPSVLTVGIVAVDAGRKVSADETQLTGASGCDLVVVCEEASICIVDPAPRSQCDELQLLGDLTPKIDCQQAVDEVAPSTRMISKLEATLERASSNATMQILCVLVGTTPQQEACSAPGRSRLAETGDCHSDTVIVLAGLRDVVRPVIDARPGWRPERVDKAVETTLDRTGEKSKVVLIATSSIEQHGQGFATRPKPDELPAFGRPATMMRSISGFQRAMAQDCRGHPNSATCRASDYSKLCEWLYEDEVMAGRLSLP